MRIRERWLWLCSDLGVSGEEAFQYIENKYNVPKRYYHTLEGHVGKMLSDLDENTDLAEKLTELKFAIVCHDMIQEIGSQDNELRSAEEAIVLARKLGLSREFQHTVHRYVMVTAHGVETPRTNDERLMVDLDLIYLGGSYEDFLADTLNVRLEYGRYSDLEFAAGRKSFMEGMLENAPFFHLPRFVRKYQERAEDNFRRDIARCDEILALKSS